MNSKKYLITGIILVVLIGIGGFGLGIMSKRLMVKATLTDNSLKNLPIWSADSLKNYDGSDPTKPIFIGLNGYVYDVSAGRDYYKTDGSYHYLAGKDSSSDLNLIGGDIIARKYPIVAVLKSP